MKARPNLNGNTRQDFVDVYSTLFLASSALEEASSLLASNVLHSRNYTHIDGGDVACIADRHRIFGEVQKCREILTVISIEIVDAIES